VDDELRGLRAEGLRVVDVSDAGPRGRQHQCPVIMIAEKAADLIRGGASARTDRSTHSKITDSVIFESVVRYTWRRGGAL